MQTEGRAVDVCYENRVSCARPWNPMKMAYSCAILDQHAGLVSTHVQPDLLAVGKRRDRVVLVKMSVSQNFSQLKRG